MIQREFLLYIWDAGRVPTTRLDSTRSVLSYNSGLFGGWASAGLSLQLQMEKEHRPHHTLPVNFMERERESSRMGGLTSGRERRKPGSVL